MYGLPTIIRMNARAAASAAKDTPPPIPREKRRMGWFTDMAMVKLKAELLNQPGGPGPEATKLIGSIETEQDYRRREAKARVKDTQEEA